MTQEDLEAFEKAWSSYPTQDNEGYVPDRGGFKAGWFAALEWERSRVAETESKPPEDTL